MINIISVNEPEDLAGPDILIPYEDDDYSRFNCVGIHKGKQFMAFVTGATPVDPETGEPEFLVPGIPGWDEKKRWYGIIHLFEMDGRHSQTVAFLGGTTAEGQQEAQQAAFQELNSLILSMDQPSFEDIRVKPFRHEEDGYLFGLVLDEDGQHATLWPNDILFHAPFDGSYST